MITYDNDQYFWRVRVHRRRRPANAVDRGTLRLQPHLAPTAAGVFPATRPASSIVGAPLYFQWDPVPHASEYEFQIGTNENFSPTARSRSAASRARPTPPVMFAINTTGQSHQLRSNEDCARPSTRHYWRVRPLDRPFSKPR